MSQDVQTWPEAAQTLQQKIEDRSLVLGIIGLGYVGLPLSLTFHKAGFRVLGFDIDPRKIEALAEGTPYIKHLGVESFQELAQSSNFEATTDFVRLAEADAIMICVPTPIGDHREPDLSYVLNSGRSIAKTLRPGQLIILESTTYPGTTDTELRRVLDEVGLTMGSDYFLAFSPEREDPGNPDFQTHNIPKVVGGVGEIATQLSVALYQTAIEEVVEVSSARVAEATKLMENIYRAVNIALVNELKMIFGRLDIDVWEVLDAASTKPFGFKRFNPGPGWGGHCIPIDPFYLTWKAKAVGMTSHFIERAGEVNVLMPHYVVNQLQDALNGVKKAMNGSRVLLLGIAYKPDIDDVRESPAFPIWDLLLQGGAEVSFYDPHADEVPRTRKWPHLAGQRGVEFEQETLNSFDAVILLANHKALDYELLRGYEGVVVDTRNAIARDMGLNLVQA